MLRAFAQAWASWKTSPGVAVLAIIALAVGIGSATAIFTVINGVLFRPLPYPDGDRYVSLYGASTTDPGTLMAMSVPELQDYERQTTSFDAFGWFRAARFSLTAPGEPRFVRGAAVTPALARQLGQPILGQWFTDDTSAVISSTLWRRLGGRSDIIGSAITLDNRRYTVSGVMPATFRLPIITLGISRGDSEVWIPLDPSPPNASRGSSNYFAYARRKPGVSLPQANADAKRVASLVAASDPTRYRNYTAGVVDLHEPIAPSLRASLLILLGGAGLLLLIGCANVATLLLARSVARARETAIRVALGAPRSQLALRYFAEGALLSGVGAVAGVGLSAVLLRYLLDAASAFIPRIDDIAIDWTVLGFSVTVALATGVLAGLAPLWQALRMTPNAVLSEGVRASAAAPARRVSRALVVAEIALAFTLMATSAMLLVHLRNLGHAPLGFDPDGLVAFDVALPRRVMQSNAWRAEQARLMDALRQTPGVTGATFANQLPGAVCGGTAIYVDGRPPDALGQRVCLVPTTPDFFATMRIPLRAGRLLNESDGQQHEPMAAVINETAARVFWPDRNPTGASARFSGGADASRFYVVGVVGDVTNSGLKQPPAPQLYLSASVVAVNPMSVAVRSDLPADQAMPRIRRAIQQTNPTLVMEHMSTMRDILSGTLQLERLSSLVMTFFGLAALLMATLGIYGVVSYFVRQRTVELGTRMALGATSRDLVALVLRGGLRLAFEGVAVGSIALVGAMWLLVRFLEVSDFGWLPVACSAAVVILVAGAAASVPAWRTTHLSPMVAIRDQQPSVWGAARQRVQRAAREIRQAVSGNDSESDDSAADMLTAFVDAAHGADSYPDALRAVLASLCDTLNVKSAALLGREDGSPPQYRCLVAVGALDASAPSIAEDGYLMTRLRAYRQPLPFASTELEALAEWAAAHRPERVDEIRALAAAGVRLAVALRTRRAMPGVLLLGERPQREGFSAHEKQALRACADQLVLMIENARLTTRVVEQEILRRDIALASDVQRRLLPTAPPRAGCADFAAISVAARGIGGDYYDFVELSDGGIGIALADVSGKGVAAALIMSVVQASLRIISSDGAITPAQLVTRLNAFVYRSTPESKYATFFYAQFDEPRRQLRYVNAGHNAPYLLRAGGHSSNGSASPEIEQLCVGGTVVGMFSDMGYEEAAVDLWPGDVLLAFTDGVPEAHNPEKAEFGEERLQQLLCQTAHLSADGISARITAEMKNWIGDAEHYDDLTFIVMKVR